MFRTVQELQPDVVPYPLVITTRRHDVQAGVYGGRGRLLPELVPTVAAAGLIDADLISRRQDNLQCWQPRCQEAVRRPLVQLQQVGEASKKHHRPADGSNQAQALTAHRRGK